MRLSRPSHLCFAFGVTALLALVTVDNSSGDTLTDKAACHEFETEVKTAIKACERLIRADTSDTGNLARNFAALGVHYKRAGSRDVALNMLDVAIGFDPEYADGHVFRGTLLIELARLEEADAAFAKALKLDPTHMEGLLGRGNVSFRSRQYDRALADFDTVLGVHPNQEVALIGRGSLNFEIENYASAIKDLSAAIKVNPTRSNTYYQRGVVYLILKNWTEAEMNFEMAYALGLRLPELLQAREHMKGLKTKAREFLKRQEK